MFDVGPCLQDRKRTYAVELSIRFIVQQPAAIPSIFLHLISPRFFNPYSSVLFPQVSQRTDSKSSELDSRHSIREQYEKQRKDQSRHNGLNSTSGTAITGKRPLEKTISMSPKESTAFKKRRKEDKSER